MSDANKQPAPDVWAVVELMGHVKLAGRLTQEEQFGAKLGRLDIPQADGTFVTKFFGGQSVYAVTVVTEAVARRVAETASSPAPVSPWDFPKALPAPARLACVNPGCGTPSEPDCDNGRCALHCDERCDTHCERSLREIHDGAPEF